MIRSAPSPAAPPHPRARSSAPPRGRPAAGARLLSHRAFLGLGSNLGPRAAQLVRAISLLGGRGIVPCAWSSIYESRPLGPWPDQPPFFNAVIAVRTQLSAEGLLQAMLAIERTMGRRRLRAQGPRLIDLDLLLYDDEVRRTAAPLLPHPRLHQRAFALRPLLELEAELRDPRDGLPLARHLPALVDQRLVRRGRLFGLGRRGSGRATHRPTRP